MGVSFSDQYKELMGKRRAEARGVIPLSKVETPLTDPKNELEIVADDSNSVFIENGDFPTPEMFARAKELKVPKWHFYKKKDALLEAIRKAENENV